MHGIDDLIIKPLKTNIDHRGRLIETWRTDQDDFRPEMMYISYSNPGVRRGAHLHLYQTDFFIFIGPGNFRVVVIDNRPDSQTYLDITNFYAGANNPTSVMIPPNCWHGYQNVSNELGMVINIPDKLYRGLNYSETVDEVRGSWTNLYSWPEIID